jgi:hypothetical protein
MPTVKNPPTLEDIDPAEGSVVYESYAGVAYSDGGITHTPTIGDEWHVDGGPFQHPDNPDTLYWFGIDTQTATGVRDVYLAWNKSTDDGLTWPQFTTTGARILNAATLLGSTIYPDRCAVACCQRNNLVYIFYRSHPIGNIRVRTFDMDTDTLSSDMGSGGPAGHSTDWHPVFGWRDTAQSRDPMFACDTGTLMYVIANGARDSDGGGDARCYATPYNPDTDSWGISFALGAPGDTEGQWPTGICADAAGRVYCFYQTTALAPFVQQCRVISAGGLSISNQVTVHGTAARGSLMFKPRVIGSTVYALVPQRVGATYTAILASAAVADEPTFSPQTINTGISGNFCDPIFAHVTGSKAVCIQHHDRYSGTPNNWYGDLRHNFRSGGSWQYTSATVPLLHTWSTFLRPSSLDQHAYSWTLDQTGTKKHYLRLLMSGDSNIAYLKILLTGGGGNYTDTAAAGNFTY